MLTREATYEDYGFSEDEDKRLGEFCKNLEMRDKILLLQCAAEVYPNIRRSLQHTYELAELFRIACSGNEAFMELSEEDQERFWLITDALMMNDPEDLKRVHNLANYLMVKRIKDNAKVAEA